MTSSTPCYGATENEWLTLDAWHGLTADLLPVVANPKAVISPDSKMRDKGKVPSRYNRHGDVAGFPNWTQYKATAEDIERWKKRGDYGICIQTRTLRALDVDVPDFDLAAKLEDFIISRLGSLPMRVRGNSSKFLLAFRIEGEMPKRVIKVREKQVDSVGKTVESAWVIEFLATGQQFIAAGTHTSGARIEWVGGMPDAFPSVSVEQFEQLWKDLEATFACEASHTAGIRKRGEHFEAKDDTADLLDKKGLILGEGNDGQLFVECPWKGDHSMDSGITECAYFPRGSGGYTLGHFKCMHAGCASHDDTDFEEALGLRDEIFEKLPAVVDAKGKVVKALPPLERNKAGDIEANLYNLELALQQPDICGLQIRYDDFLVGDIVALPGQAGRPMTDGDSVRLRKRLERFGFKPIGREMMRDAITAHGEDNRFDSAIEWAESLGEWDGIERLDRYFIDYFGAEDTPYARAVGRYVWTALAGRALVPGIKADMAVILHGEQGIIKSTAISSMVPWGELFCELDMNDDDEKLARLMRGKLIGELGELRGFHGREFEGIKAWIVRRFDQWVPKFKERSITVSRRAILIGTTNHAEFLVDETGNRRFLPITVGRAIIEKILADRTELWREAVTLFKRDGIAWQDAERLAKAEHEKFTVQDSWEEAVGAWLVTADIDGTTPGEREFIRIGEVLSNALNIDARSANLAAEKRVGRCLRKLGYEKTQRTVDGKKSKVFIPRV